jgi:ubiquinone/menaquinone biosynthesis C-methylase UbiE
MNFDLKARDWDKDPLKVERARVFAGEIIKFIGKKKITSALEFGSGTGLVSFQLKDHFKSITLADNSQGMTEVLTEKIKNEKILNMKPLFIDLFKDKNELSGFDIIYTLLALHHIRDINRTFEVFYRLLKPGGYVCIGDLVTESGSFHNNDRDFDGHNGFETKELKEKLVSKGFKVEFDSIFTEIVKEYKNEIRKYPLFLLIGKKL